MLASFAKTAASSLGLRAGLALEASSTLKAMGVRGMAQVMDGLKYAKSHEWAKLEGDIATVGISEFAQAELGDVVYVEVPEVGTTVTKGETFGVVESVKAASDVYSPISGEVIATNDMAAENPSLVNEEPFGEGWLIKVKVSDASELDSLLDSVAYKQLTESAGH